jgi:uncharacterized protein
MKKLIIDLSTLKDDEVIEGQIDNYICSSLTENDKGQDIQFSYKVLKLVEGYNLEAAIKGNITCTCSKCLDVFKLAVDRNISRFYEKNTVELDVFDEIKQTLFLEMPSNPVCKDDCSGLCHKCGINLNNKKCSCIINEVDTRWEKLKDFIKK